MMKVSSSSLRKQMKRLLKMSFYKEILLQPSKLLILASLLWVAEIFVNIIVIENVPYTEIDWKAYMQQVEGVSNYTFDYMQLKGETGPLVYPAGFIYIYLVFYYITEFGTNVHRAQYLFAVIYLATLIAVFRLYHKTQKVPPFVMIFICCASYRIHSIYILRLFNDPVAMLFLYMALNMFIDNRFGWGCFLYSVAVSVKMNILLFAPGLALVLLMKFGVLGSIPYLSICATVQLVLGLPFLIANPVAYIVKSFELSRQFFYQWTVNWRLISEELFLSRYLHITLLSLHIVVLLLFLLYRWMKPTMTVMGLLTATPSVKSSKHSLTASNMLLIFFTSNYIGMVFSRTLHYQFYVWYFHSLPYLLWHSSDYTMLRYM